jgi:FKBP-type peptidyl-prolyl cis-trans isomerase
VSKRPVLLLVLALFVLAAAGMVGCGTPSATSPAGSSSVATQAAQPATAPVTTEPTTPPVAEPTELKIKDKVVGKGVAAKTGDAVTVDYTGWLVDGTQFDSSIGRAPFKFTLGAGMVIEGWDTGVVGMKVGGVRTLTIPSALAYGPQGRAPIPPNATLVFDVKLLKIN